MRLGLGLAGIAALGYGIWLLLDLLLGGVTEPVGVATWWLAGPVVVDFLAVPVVVLCGVAVRRFVPGGWRRFVAGGLVLSLLLTLVAFPFLTGLGRRPDNPSLLDRNYTTGYLLLLAAAWGGWGALQLVRRVRRQSSAGVTPPAP